MSSGSGAGQSPHNHPRRTHVPETHAATGIRQVGVVMVPVTDQDRALDFYVGKLGFDKRADVPLGEGERWVEVAPSGADTRLALVRPRDGGVGGDARIGLTTPDVEAEHAELKARGIDVDAEIMRMGG